MKELNGKVAVVTGAASGIGFAMSERFVSEGMSVVMADVEEEALARSATQLESEGADVLGVLCDVSDAASVKDLAEQTLSAYGGVHVVCNNAGVGPGGLMLETTAEEWEWIVGVNVMGVAHGVITFGPILAEAGEGHIVNTASEAGLVTNSALGMYCATKHAVVGLSESLWRELHPLGVGVSCLCPNLVNTQIFQSERNRPYDAELTATQNAIMTPMREMLSARGIAPSEVAANVLDAIVEDRFWVFTHDITPEAAAVRFTDIEARRNPTDPYEGAEF
ncbi:SDR family NAD(P)-dependent oxidoreductase [Candidatus Poriferisocius sp.]|uniref:SDR family NAD(P)-dependent oxidoreductase n=1 Tax=Candidatus Poriferisocius sp. TaxID=3101276 RepID=UPI003B0227D0